MCDSIYDSYENDDFKSMDERYIDTTDIQGNRISDSYKNEETKNYENDGHSSSWRHTIANIKLKLSRI